MNIVAPDFTHQLQQIAAIQTTAFCRIIATLFSIYLYQNVGVTLQNSNSEETTMFSIDLSRSKSRSISPAKSLSKLNTTRSTNNLTENRLFNLPKIPSYYKINKPILNQQMKSHIEEKINFERETEATYKKRQKSQDYFIKYKKNPFAPAKSPQELQLSLPSQHQVVVRNDVQPQYFHEEKRNKIFENIIEGVNALRQKNVLVKDKSLKTARQEAARVSKKALLNTKHLNYSGNFKKKEEEKINTESVELNLKQITLEEILAIQEQSYYRKNQRQINIFSVIKSNPKFLNCSLLEKYYFSYTSIIEKAEQHIRFPIYRDLSRKSRISSLKNKYSKQELLQFISSKDINSNTAKLRCEDMLGVASGRCTSELISDWINKEASNNVEEGDKNKTIVLKENMRNMNTFINQQNPNVREANDWKQRKIAVFKEYNKQCQKLKQNVLDKAQSKVKLTRNTVIDKQTHKELSKQIKNDILYFLAKDKLPRGRQRQKLIYLQNQAATVNKSQSLKVEKLIQTVKNVKNSYKQIQKFGHLRHCL